MIDPGRPGRSHKAGAVIVALALALTLGGPAAYYFSIEESGINYSTRPAHELFKEVTGADPEPGITNIRAAGRCSFAGLKHWVWITCDASEPVLQRIVKGEDPLDLPAASRAAQESWAASKRLARRDQRLVGWSELTAAKNRSVYYISASKPNSSFIWAGVLVYDRDRGKAYIHAGGD
jgi:hypothetical protein